jgi:serine phosphatase RsbU (regulator of sigma subunit)
MTEGLLPEIPERIGAWQFSQRYEPQSDEAPVGGDLFDLFLITPGKWGVFIADVSGKGLAAARRIALVKYALRSYAREHASPAKVLDHLNDTLFDEPELTGFVTLFYAVFHEDTGEVVWSSAGHETPILRRANGDFERLQTTGTVLGAMNDVTFAENRSVFGHGDGLLLFTDGLSEARAPGTPRRMMEVEGVERELSAILDPARGGIEAASVADAMMVALHRFTCSKLSDDTALLWMQYLPE